MLLARSWLKTTVQYIPTRVYYFLESLSVWVGMSCPSSYHLVTNSLAYNKWDIQIHSNMSAKISACSLANNMPILTKCRPTNKSIILKQCRAN